MKSVKEDFEEELEEFRKMDKEELIEEIYRLRIVLVKRNSELYKLKKDKSP